MIDGLVGEGSVELLAGLRRHQVHQHVVVALQRAVQTQTARIDDALPDCLRVGRMRFNHLEHRGGSLDVAQKVAAVVRGRFQTMQQIQDVLVGNEAGVEQLRDVVESIYLSNLKGNPTQNVLIRIGEGNRRGLDDLLDAGRAAGVVQRQIAHEIVHIAYT